MLSSEARCHHKTCTQYMCSILMFEIGFNAPFWVGRFVGQICTVSPVDRRRGHHFEELLDSTEKRPGRPWRRSDAVCGGVGAVVRVPRIWRRERESERLAGNLFGGSSSARNQKIRKSLEYTVYIYICITTTTYYIILFSCVF